MIAPPITVICYLLPVTYYQSLTPLLPDSLMATRRIGQILVDLGFLTDEQLVIILEEQEQQPSTLLGKIAEDMTLITDEQLIQALAEQMSMQTVSLEDAKFDEGVLDKISETMAQLYRIVPLAFDEKSNTLTVATCDPQNLSIQDELRTFLGYEINMVIATERDVLQTITRHYDSESESVEKLVQSLADDEELKTMISALEKEKFNITDAEALADSRPSANCSTWCCCWRSRITRRTFTSSPSKMNSASGSRRRVCCMKWFRHRVTWPSRSRHGSRSWPTWTSPSGGCHKTVGSS